MSVSHSLPDPAGQPPRWPRRLLEIHDILRSSPGEGVRRQVFEEGWLLLHSAVSRYLDLHARRMGGADREDLEDLASEKALDLARRLESGVWDLSGRDPGEIAGFLSIVARNGLVDLFRDRGRLVERQDDEAAEPGAGSTGVPERPEVPLERKAFAESLKDCAGRLSGRDRAVWFFRIFYELKSREIAEHPEVRLKPAHVDVILQRCRKSVRDCMSRKGYEPDDLPPGTFAELWGAFRLPRTPAPKGNR